MKPEAEVRDSLRRWIAERSGKISAQALEDATPILERRILTSLQVMDLILYVEQLSGRPIDVSRLKPGVFRDVDTIYRNFFATDGHGG